ncbi:MAG: LamG domain-containing protein, partial [Anaerolineae bacterium]
GNGCPAAGVDGYYGRSLQFDGNDRVSVSLDLSENAYSLALWFQTACADCGIASVNLTTGRNLFLENGKICAEVGSKMCTSTAGYDDGRWHHVVHTIRSADGVQKLYADGVLAAAGSFNLPPATQETIYLGAAASRAGFVGLMDEVEVYSAVLSEEEITERFQQPIFYAKFDEPSGPFRDTIYGLPLNCSGNRCPDRVGGVRGGAVSFNQGQHLQTSGQQLDLSRGNGRFTLSAWMYPLPDDGKWHALFGDVPGNADKNQSPSLWVKGSELWARFGNGDDATQVCGFRGFVLRPNEWQHVAAAFDGNLLDVYVNGQLVGSGTDCAGLTPYPTTNLHIGRASQRGWIKFTYVDVTDEGDGWGTAEYYLSLDDVPVWAQDEIDVGAYVINETRILDDDAAHRFKLWELDDWPNGANDLNIDQTFSNATIGIFATDYDADGEGTLHWQSWNQFYEGRLDDLRLYSYALTAADVADLYQSSYRALEMRFDEPPGADTFRDYSGNGVVGVCTPPHCPDTGLAGRSNQAARFDGLDDYVDASALTGGLAGQAISFGGWVYPDTAQSSQSGLLTFENAAGNYVLNQLLYHPTQNKFSYSDGKTPPVFSQNSFAPGQWYQVMAVIE